MIYMYADQLFANGFDEQRGDDGTVYSAGQSQQYLFIADLFADCGNLLCNKLFSLLCCLDAFHRFRAHIVHIRSSQKQLIKLIIQYFSIGMRNLAIGNRKRADCFTKAEGTIAKEFRE